MDSVVRKRGIQCVRCKTLVGADRTLNGEIVEENLVRHDVREGLGSYWIKTMRQQVSFIPQLTNGRLRSLPCSLGITRHAE